MTGIIGRKTGDVLIIGGGAHRSRLLTALALANVFVRCQEEDPPQKHYYTIADYDGDSKVRHKNHGPGARDNGIPKRRKKGR